MNIGSLSLAPQTSRVLRPPDATYLETFYGPLTWLHPLPPSIVYCVVLSFGSHEHLLTVSSHVDQGSVKILRVRGVWGQGPSMYVASDVRGGGPCCLQTTWEPWSQCTGRQGRGLQKEECLGPDALCIGTKISLN